MGERTLLKIFIWLLQLLFKTLSYYFFGPGGGGKVAHMKVLCSQSNMTMTFSQMCTIILSNDTLIKPEAIVRSFSFCSIKPVFLKKFSQKTCFHIELVAKQPWQSTKSQLWGNQTIPLNFITNMKRKGKSRGMHKKCSLVYCKGKKIVSFLPSSFSLLKNPSYASRERQGFEEGCSKNNTWFQVCQSIFISFITVVCKEHYPLKLLYYRPLLTLSSMLPLIKFKGYFTELIRRNRVEGIEQKEHHELLTNLLTAGKKYNCNELV